MRVFLDANVLFSAALGGEVFRLIWLLAERGRLELCTSLRCWLEAEFNLERKRPRAAPRLPLLMQRVQLVAEPEGSGPPCDEPLKTLFKSLPDKDRPVLQAALQAQAQILLTGDLKHFGPLMQREDLPLRVLSPGDFIRRVRPGS
ncbi:MULTISPECIES: PIN domain-containing protein [unclassified Meiothermus]|uniref:PIN domain-containing protein n=1 Tax=unclassified Meiothermus TaxID=370471 RepID=UPI000D7BD4DB|nr:MULTISPECIES: PIN domain-containing protein [unclassified Meiothermus]PZA08203.1 DNA-binding protein [Meiothermus sp. Pnk-1]RYM39412.1 PIN domain-containing protein [Meiothermus sp. PNK-Is4]